jgi:predicted peptidase
LTTASALLLAAALGPTAPAETAPGYVAREFDVAGRRHAYRAWLPPGFDRARRWPVIVYLHGVRQRGSDGEAPTRAGLGPALEADPARFPAVVVFPQCAEGRFWILEDMLDLAWAVTRDAIAAFAGDPERVVLTGASMGGYGVWELAAKHPHAFAGLVPVCGGLDRPRADPGAERDVARRLEDVPVWMFHSADDPVVPVEGSRRMAAAFRARGVAVRYTEYTDAGHAAWLRAYADPELAAWMVSRSRAPKR